MRISNHFAGVLGWPLDYTLSPVIHNAAFRSLGLDWVYLAWPVAPDDLEAAVGGLRALGAMGANVTVPHKEAVTKLLDDLSGDARVIGAVNTIQRVGDQLVGHNTDVDGFRRLLTNDAGVDPSGSKALVVGTGGAARAVVKALSDLGVADVTVAGRNPRRTAEVASLAKGGRPVDFAAAVEEVGAAVFIVNATTLGMAGEDPLEGAVFGPGQCVVDLIYAPPATPLVRRARAAGADGWGGLGMLVHQAAAAIRIWTGTNPPLETMSAAALHAIGARANKSS